MNDTFLSNSDFGEVKCSNSVDGLGIAIKKRDKHFMGLDKLSLSREQLIVEQRNDEKMSSLFEAVVPVEQLECVSQGYFVEDGVLMRKWRPSNAAADDEWQIVQQVVVPPSYRSEILIFHLRFCLLLMQVTQVRELYFSNEIRLVLNIPFAIFHKFNKHQRRYSTIEKEGLALVLALQHFDVYVGSVSYSLIVYTDHNPLVFLNRMKHNNQRLMRWSLFLQTFELDIRHIRGKDNVIADALSRV